MHHQTFGWDSPDGDPGAAEAFVALGFRLLSSSVLTASSVSRPPHFAERVVVRTLTTDEDWREAAENQIRCREPEHDEAGYRTFKEAQMRRYRRMSQAGLGDWFGAFVDGVLVADLGIYRTGRLGRFQSVETAPEHRRRGVAGSLVYLSARQALERWGLETLVLVADADSAAERLYRALGFLPTESAVALERWDPGDGVENAT